MNPAIVTGLVYLALTAVDAFIIWGGHASYFDIPVSSFDLVASLISTPLGLAAGTGLLLRRLWGWWTAIASAALGLVTAVSWMADSLACGCHSDAPTQAP